MKPRDVHDIMYSLIFAADMVRQNRLFKGKPGELVARLSAEERAVLNERLNEKTIKQLHFWPGFEAPGKYLSDLKLKFDREVLGLAKQR